MYFQSDSLDVRYKFCSRYKSRILMKKWTASCFESQKTVNTNIIIDEMREKSFVQTKNYSNRRYLPVTKEGLTIN